MGRKNNNKSLVNSQHKLRLSLQDRKIVKDSYSDFNKDLAQWEGEIHYDNLKYIVANAIIHANADKVLRDASVIDLEQTLLYMTKSEEGGVGFIPKRFASAMLDVIQKPVKVSVKLDGQNIILPEPIKRFELWAGTVMNNLSKRNLYLADNLFDLFMEYGQQTQLNKDGEPNISDHTKKSYGSDLMKDQEVKVLHHKKLTDSENKRKKGRLTKSLWEENLKRLQEKEAVDLKYEQSRSSNSMTITDIDPLEAPCSKIVAARNEIYRNPNAFESACDNLREAEKELEKVHDDFKIEKIMISCDIKFQRALIRKKELTSQINMKDKVTVGKDVLDCIKLSYEESESLVSQLKVEDGDLLISALLQQAAILHVQYLIVSDVNKLEQKTKEDIDELEKSREVMKNSMENGHIKWVNRLKELKIPPSVKTVKLEELKGAYKLLCNSGLINSDTIANPNKILSDIGDKNIATTSSEGLISVSIGSSLLRQRKEKIKKGLAQFDKDDNRPQTIVKNTFIEIRDDVKSCAQNTFLG